MCRHWFVAFRKASWRMKMRSVALCLALALLAYAPSASAEDQLITYFKTSDTAVVQEMRLQNRSILDYELQLFDNGTNPFNFVTVEFSVQKTGLYLFGQNQAPMDTVMLLYKGSFNPNSVKTNLMAANDDWYRFRPASDPNKNNMGTLYVTGNPPETCSITALNCLVLPDLTLVLKNCGEKARTCPGMYSTLEANERYFMVVTHFRSDDRLNFTLPQSFWCYGGSCTFKSTVVANDPAPPAVAPPVQNPPVQNPPPQDPPPVDKEQNKIDPTTTFLSLLTQEQGLTQLMSRKASRLAQAVENDCAIFDKQGYCISFRVRATPGTASEGAGVFILSTQLQPGLRAGIFIDQVVTARDPIGFQQPDERPSFGGFIGYQFDPQARSYEMKVSIAYSPGRLISTREIILDTEAGRGVASFNAYAMRGEVARRIQFNDLTVTPFAGLRHLQVIRGSYSEAHTNGVDAPINFNELRLNVTSAFAGIRLEGRLTTQWGYQLSLSGEYDLLRRINEMSGTSAIEKLETFGIHRSFNKDPVRLSATSGIFWEFAGSNRLFLQLGLRGNPRQVGAATTLLGYQISF